jgi:hypothetical protein
MKWKGIDRPEWQTKRSIGKLLLVMRVSSFEWHRLTNLTHKILKAILVLLDIAENDVLDEETAIEARVKASVDDQNDSTCAVCRGSAYVHATFSTR